MTLNEYFYKFLYFKNKTIYLIILLPITLFVGSTITNFFIISIVFIFILETVKKKNYFFLNKDFIVLSVFYIYLIFNSIFLTQTSDGIIRAIGFIRFPLLAYAIAYYFSLERGKYQKQILSLWFLIFIVTSLDIIFEYFVGYNIIGNKSNYAGRLASFSGEELKIGGYYFGFILLSIWIVLKNYKKYYLFFIILFLFCSLLIGEKANFIKSIFITSIFFILIDKKSILKKLSLISLILIFAFIFIKSNPAFNSRFLHHGFSGIKIDNYKSLVSSNQHFSHYHTAFEIFKKNPFFGVGVKNFRNVSYEKEYNTIENINGGSTHPHQIHFEILSEIGIFGYILIFGILIYFIVSGIKFYIHYKDFLFLISSLFVLATILPIIPSGSFFTTYTATIFWINLSFILRKY